MPRLKERYGSVQLSALQMRPLVGLFWTFQQPPKTLGQETDRDFIAELAKVFYCKADIVTGQTHRHPHCQTPLQRHAFALALPV